MLVVLVKRSFDNIAQLESGEPGTFDVLSTFGQDFDFADFWGKQGETDVVVAVPIFFNDDDESGEIAGHIKGAV